MEGTTRRVGTFGTGTGSSVAGPAEMDGYGAAGGGGVAGAEDGAVTDGLGGEDWPCAVGGVVDGADELQETPTVRRAAMMAALPPCCRCLSSRGPLTAPRGPEQTATGGGNRGSGEDEHSGHLCRCLRRRAAVTCRHA